MALIDGIVEAELSSGRANRNNPVHSSKDEERHRPDLVTEVSLEREESHMWILYNPFGPKKLITP